MKKTFLLTAATLMLATAGNAQAIDTKSGKPMFATKTSEMIKKVDSNALMQGKAVRPRKDAANGVYYTRPTGSLWRGVTQEGMSYYGSMLTIAPGKDLVFNNMSTGAENSVWTYGGEVMTSGIDENYNFNLGYFSGYNYYIYGESRGPLNYSVPELTIGANSYTIGQESEYFTSEYGGSSLLIDSLASLSYANPRTADAYGLGSFDNYYLYGSGTLTYQGTVYTGYGVVQRFPAPMSPLYVEGLHASVLTHSEPLAADATIEALVIEMVNDSTLGDTIAILTATADECTMLSEPTQQGQYGLIGVYNINFTQKELDELGQPTVVPFTIDRPFVLQILGLDNDGVDIGFRGVEPIEEDNALADCGYGRIALELDGNQYSMAYNGIYLDINFDALFDNVTVCDTLYDDEGNAAYTNLNVLRVSADGTEISTEGSTEDTNIGAAVLLTAFDWTDGTTEVDNYTFLDMPDWVSFDKAENLDESSRIESQESQGVTYCFAGGYTMLTFNVEALPDGTTGRAARIYVQGRGVTAPTPIIILQGNATIADGIESVMTPTTHNGKTYNAAGQRVSNNAKGIIIKDGKKYFVK